MNYIEQPNREEEKREKELKNYIVNNVVCKFILVIVNSGGVSE